VSERTRANFVDDLNASGHILGHRMQLLQIRQHVCMSIKIFTSLVASITPPMAFSNSRNALRLVVVRRRVRMGLKLFNCSIVLFICAFRVLKLHSWAYNFTSTRNIPTVKIVYLEDDPET